MAERDFRIVNMADGQQIEYDQVLKRIGEISYRNFGVFCKSLLFDDSEALVTKGLRVEPSSGLVVNVTAGAGIQQVGDQELLPFVATEDQTVTIDAASGVARVDMIEAQVQAVETKSDYTFKIIDPESIIVSTASIYRDVKYILAVQKKTSSTTPTAAIAGVLTGTVAITGTVDLGTEYLINVADGEDGEFIEIDCRGAVPETTSAAEIVANINAAIGRVAASTSAGYIIYTGEGLGITSAFYFKSPVTNPALDALEIIFGLSIAGDYLHTYVGTNEWFKIAEINMGTATTTLTTSEIVNLDEKALWVANQNDINLYGVVYDEIENVNDSIKKLAYLNWNKALSAEQNQWYSVAYGDGIFVAVSIDGTNQVMRSVDLGLTWSAIAASEVNPWVSIAYGGGVFISVAFDGTNRIMRSTDLGLTWSAIAASEANSWRSIAYGNRVFVAVSSDGTNRVMYSTDLGLTWVSVLVSEAIFWQSITYGNGVFVAVSKDGIKRVMISTDLGLTWVNIVPSEQNSWVSITYRDGVFVAVAYDGTNRVMRSLSLPE